MFFAHQYPNYVPDLLQHGLRKLLGPDVIDYPRKDCLYNGVLGLGVCSDELLCPNWFPQDNGTIDREEILEKNCNKYFDYIVCDNRAATYLENLITKLSLEPSYRLVIIDGEDIPVGCGRRKTHPEVIAVDMTPKGSTGSFGNVAGNISPADIQASGDQLDMFDNGELDYLVQMHNLEHYQDIIKTLQNGKEWLNQVVFLGWLFRTMSAVIRYS